MVRNTNAVRKRKTRSGKIKWVIDFTYLDEQGRQRRYRRDAQLQTAAGAKAEARRLQMLAVTKGTLETRSAAPTLAAFVRGKFEELFLPRYRPSTRKRYEGLLPLLVEKLGKRRLDEIGARDARALAAELDSRGTTTKPHVTLLKTILRAAHEVGLVDEVPKLPRLHKESRKLPAAPTREEIDALVGGARGWLRVAIGLAAYAGLRSGEVRALQIGDLEGGVIHVRRSLSGGAEMPPKSGNDRVVPIAEPLRALLEASKRGKLPRARVVLTERGSTPSRQLIYRRMQQLQRRLGFQRLWSFHACRHAFVSLLVRGGASLEAVRLLAGHSKLDVTQRYVHATGDDLLAAVGKLELVPGREGSGH